MKFYKQSAMKNFRSDTLLKVFPNTINRCSCLICSPAALVRQSDWAIARTTTVHFPARQQLNWSVCHKQLIKLYKLEYASLSKADLDSQITETLSSLRVTDAEVRYVDKSTVNQAGCLTWFLMRAGCITDSRAHAVLLTRLDHPSALLFHDICSDSAKCFYAPASTWGKDHEDTALSLYQNIANTSPEQGGTQILCWKKADFSYRSNFYTLGHQQTV